MFFWGGICIIGYVIKLVFYAVSTTLSHHSAYSILKNMRLRIADRLMRAPLGTVINKKVGDLKSVIVDRVETIELPLAHLIPEGISNLILPLGVFIYLILIDWRMALASMITVPIAGAAYAVMMRNFNSQYEDFMKSSNYVNDVIVEYVEGIEVIKAFNQSTSSYEKYEKAVSTFKEYTLNWFKSTWKLMNFGGSVLPSTLLGTMPVGMYLYIRGDLTPAELTMCLILSLGIVAPLTSFTVFINDAKTIQYAVKDAEEFLNMGELPNAMDRVYFKDYPIELKNVIFSYNTEKTFSLGNTEDNVLKDINIKIPQGSFTALVGTSGGGKSTIARLIARFWDVSSGEIKIGDINIKDIPLEQLADTVSFVTQDNFLFNCSLMENIRLGNPKASDEEVINAAKAACCHEFIEKLDKGYDANAGEAGGNLSGGERQRIAIARAILKNAPIVILDEATAFTDPENEDKIQKSIATLTKDKTLLVIAHRLSTIKNAGEITSAVTTDLSFIEMLGMKMIDVVVNAYISAFTMVICIAFYNLWIAIIALAGILLSALFLKLLGDRSNENAPVHQRSQDNMIAATIEYIRGMPVVKAFKQDGVSRQGIGSAYKMSKDINIKIENEYVPYNCLHLFSLKAASVVIVVAAAVMAIKGQMDISTMLMMAIFSFVIFGHVESVNNAAHVMEIIDATMDKLESIEKAEFIDKKGREVKLSSYNIQFKDVTFAYEKKAVLKNLSFTIPQNTTTAIVGPSGSGKSTICSLIARFYDVNKGQVIVGGY